MPDEPGHVAIVESSRFWIWSAEPTVPARQDEILLSMGRYDWWRHYGAPAPATMPATFEKLGTDNAVETLAIAVKPEFHPRPYYASIAVVLSVLPTMPVVVDLYVMRMLSALLGMLTLYAAWRGAQEGLGAVAGAVIAAVLVLHPQFAVVSTTAGPDALIIFFGACIWWQAMVGLRAENWLRPLALLWVAAIGAAMTDRMGVPVAVHAVILSVVVIARRTGLLQARLALSITMPRFDNPNTISLGFLRGAVAVAVVAAAVVVSIVWMLDAFVIDVTTALSERVLPVDEAQTLQFFTLFTTSLYESWWFSLGWFRYLPEPWWLAITVVVSTAALAGVARGFARKHDAQVNTIAWVAVVMMVVQIAAVSWVYYRFAHGPQGRHLYPCLVPTLVLLWFGFTALVPLKYQPHAAIALVLVFALLDVTAWTAVAIPAYMN